MLHRRRILLLEKEAGISAAVAGAAEADGYAVEPAADVRSFISRLEDDGFALLVADVGVAVEADGFDLLAGLTRSASQAEALLLGPSDYLAQHGEELARTGIQFIASPFTSGEVYLSVTQALRRQCLREEHQHEEDVSRELMNAVQRTAGAVTPHHALHAILQAAHRVIPQAEQVLMARQTDTGVVLLGLKDGRLAHLPSLGGSILSRVMESAQTVYDPDWTDDAPHGTPRSLLAVPLLAGDVVQGAIVAICPPDATFSDSQRRALTALASHAVIVLRSARLQLQGRWLDELEALYEAGQAINRSLGLQETLVTTMSVTRGLVRASVSNIYLYTAESKRLDSVVTLGDDAALSDLDRQRAVRIAWDTVGEVLEGSTEGSVLSFPATESATDTAVSPEGEKNPHVQSWLAVPLVVGDVPIGVLQLGSERPNAFSLEDGRLVRVIASQAATAVRNARLFEEVQQRLRQSEALDDITRSVNNTLDLSQVLQLVVRSAVRAIPAATDCSLYMSDERHQTFSIQSKYARHDSPVPSELESVSQRLIAQAARQGGAVRADWGTWSLLVAPLLVGDAVIGAIRIHSPFADAFGANDEKILASFASHAATAIQNANLFRDLSSAYDSLTRQQAELLQRQTTQQALFDSITDGLYIVGGDLRIAAINRKEAERVGAEPDALLGRQCDEALWGGGALEVVRLVKETIRNRHQANWEAPADDPGVFAGRDVHTYPIFDPSGEVVQVIILAQDLSEKRWLQASLFRSANMAAVGQLASSIAHQINNPLTVVIANAQLMQMDSDPTSPTYPIINDILQGGVRISQIVRQFVDFAGPDDYDWGEVDLEETIERALAFTSRSLYRSNITVTRQIDDLPQIIASASQLTVVWMHLLLNARDAIVARLGESNGEVRRQVQIRALQVDQEHLRVQIIDNGEGIAARHRDRLFHPFFTTRDPGKGVGLGLFTSRKIVECHQGLIEIDDNPDGAGAVVTVTLPLVADPRASGGS